MIKLPTTSLGSLKKFVTQHKDVILKYIVTELARGMGTNADRVELFQFGDTMYVMICHRSEYATVLEQALEYFIKQEMYEEAAQCRDLIQQAKIDDIIRKSQTSD